MKKRIVAVLLAAVMMVENISMVGANEFTSITNIK